jgi:leucyl aminopeptidase
MTDFTRLLAPDRGEAATRLALVAPASADAFRASLAPPAQALMDAAQFRGQPDKAVLLPDPAAPSGWFAAVGTPETPGRWTLAAAAALLPPGLYRADRPLPALALHGWLLAQHRFGRYRKEEPQGPRTLLADPALIDAALREADATATLRDLVDTPAEHMGPADLEAALRDAATAFGARADAITGEALLAANFPAIHAVGRASPRRPRLLTLDWGEEGAPVIALVGKGITFDTGGLNLKPGNSMGLMKKDMGGAAHALALARMVMAARLPVRLRLIIAAADNAVSGDAIRPGDVIATRKGLSIEIGNTDAEGRLVLADALALAAEAAPVLILDFATLTGAARVALGPDLPALMTNCETLAADLLAAATAAEDPLWRLPLWRPYRDMFKSSIADLNNNAEGGMAGAIVGGLFLEHFVPPSIPWAHLDLYAWNNAAKPGRPKGGAAMGLAAAFTLLERRYGPR